LLPHPTIKVFNETMKNNKQNVPNIFI